MFVFMGRIEFRLADSNLSFCCKRGLALSYLLAMLRPACDSDVVSRPRLKSASTAAARLQSFAGSQSRAVGVIDVVRAMTEY